MGSPIIIVASSKMGKKFGRRLQNLIKINNKYHSQLLDAETYNKNKTSLISSKNIIFIDDIFSPINDYDLIEWKYNELNMTYGWLGSIAVILVKHHRLTLEEFYRLGELLGLHEWKIRETKVSDFIVSGGDSGLLNAIAGTLALFFSMIPMLFKVAIIFAGSKVPVFNKLISKHESKKHIECQYAYLISKFFFDALDEYMTDYHVTIKH
jgi:hypothetical protein